MQDSSLFDERKAAHAAAFLLHRAGGTLPLLKLMKLMYLAERASFKRYGDSITGDQFVSMPHGPVLSLTYDHMNGARFSCEDGWEAWISDKENYCVSLKDPGRISNPETDLLALSESDVECISEVWSEFGGMSKYELVAYTHSSACPEWHDPKGSSRPIPYATLFKALGYSTEEADALRKRLHDQHHINAAFA